MHTLVLINKKKVTQQYLVCPPQVNPCLHVTIGTSEMLRVDEVYVHVIFCVCAQGMQPVMYSVQSERNAQAESSGVLSSCSHGWRRVGSRFRYSKNNILRTAEGALVRRQKPGSKSTAATGSSSSSTFSTLSFMLTFSAQQRHMLSGIPFSVHLLTHAGK